MRHFYSGQTRHYYSGPTHLGDAIYLMLNNGIIERLSATMMRVYLQKSVRRFCTNVLAPSRWLPSFLRFASQVRVGTSCGGPRCHSWRRLGYDALAIKSLKFGHPTSR